MLKPATKDQLWNFIARYFGMKLPRRKFSANHSTPFDFVADAFFHPRQDLAAWANRRGGKTIAASIIAALDYYRQRGPIRGRVLSGSEDQAGALYGYWSRWCEGLLRAHVTGGPTKLHTRLCNGDFEILASSTRAVRGPMIQRLYWDEVDEIEQEILAASIGTLNSLPRVPSRTIATSTWHRIHGPMGKLVAEAEKRGFRVHKWNIWEVIQPCPPDRHLHGRGCKDCPLEKVCMAKALSLNPRATVGIASRQEYGLFPIDDTIRQYRNWSIEQWKAEAECQRPVTQGLVYPTFDPAVHVDSQLDFQDELPTYRAIDWGLNDFVCLWIQKDKRGRVYVVDEYWERQATISKVAAYIVAHDQDRLIERTYCDPAGRSRNDQTGYSDVQIFGGAGIPCEFSQMPEAREVVNGINTVRSALAPAFGPSRLKIAARCKGLIKAFESYRLREVNQLYIDEPVKPQECDHPMDALRYFFVNQDKPHDSQHMFGCTGGSGLHITFV